MDKTTPRYKYLQTKWMDSLNREANENHFARTDLINEVWLEKCFSSNDHESMNAEEWSIVMHDYLKRAIETLKKDRVDGNKTTND